MNKDKYNNYSEIKYLDEIVSNPLIEVGHHSYYSGYYENNNFEDGCIRYLWGDETTINEFNPIEQMGWHLDKLIIGNYVCIASGATILLGGNHNHNADWISVYPFASHIDKSFQSKGNTIIKSDSWIGMKAMIMPGVTIGEGAIIAAGAIVCKDVDPYTIVGGNPAKLIKQRFNDEDIEKLLEIRWFDWKQEDIDKSLDIIMSSNIDKLYDYYLTNIK